MIFVAGLQYAWLSSGSTENVGFYSGKDSSAVNRCKVPGLRHAATTHFIGSGTVCVVYIGVYAV